MAKSVDIYSGASARDMYEASRLSQDDIERAFRDALNRYIATYGSGVSWASAGEAGAGGAGAGATGGEARENFEHSQEKAYVPWQLRGKQILLDVKYPYELNRILREEVREEVLDNLNTTVYERKREEELKKEQEEKKKKEEAKDAKEKQAKAHTKTSDEINRENLKESALTQEKMFFRYGAIIPATALIAANVEIKKPNVAQVMKGKVKDNIKAAKDLAESKLRMLKAKRESYKTNLDRLNMARQKMGLSKIGTKPVARKIERQVNANAKQAQKTSSDMVRKILLAKKQKEAESSGHSRRW